MSGAEPRACLAMHRFGHTLGVAFQIQDDLLDLVGDQAVVGKSLGKDLDKGKLTLPVIDHLAHADQASRGLALRMIMDRQAGALRELLLGSGAVQRTAHAARLLVEQGKAELPHLLHGHVDVVLRRQVAPHAQEAVALVAQVEQALDLDGLAVPGLFLATSIALVAIAAAVAVATPTPAPAVAGLGFVVALAVVAVAPVASATVALALALRAPGTRAVAAGPAVGPVVGPLTARLALVALVALLALLERPGDRPRHG